MPRHIGVAGAALASCLTTTAGAQDALTLSDIIISANRTPTEAARVASSVTVLERDQIEASGATSVVDLLGEIPGLSIAQQGPAGSPTTVSIRGANANYIVVRIDGIEVSDPTQPQIAANFGTLLTGDIERIEVLRGSQSLLYGGRAVGGVIDITTRRAVQDGPGLSAAVEAGSFNTLNAIGTATYGFERGSFAFTVQRFQTSGFSAADRRNGNTESDGNRNTVISGSGEIDVTDTLTLEAAARYGRSRVEYDGFDFATGLPADADNEQEIESWSGRVGGRLTLLDGRVENRLSLQYFASDREQRDDFPGSFDGRRTRLDYILSAELTDRVGLVAGADWQRESAKISGGIDESVRIAGGFAQLSLTPVDSVTLTAGLRYDDHSTFGDNLSWRLTGAWSPVAPLRLRATAATGFRPPSPFELFDPGFGNRALEPEQSLSLDAGADLTLSAFGRPAVLSATLFRIDIDDLIGFEFPAGYVQIPGRSRRQGVEMSGRISPLSWVDLTARYTYTDARARDGARLLRVPYHDFGVGLTLRPTERLRVTASANYVQDAVDGFPASRMPSYTLVRAQAAYAVSDTAEVFVRGDNLLDQRYQTVRGFGTAPLSGFVGLRLRF